MANDAAVEALAYDLAKFMRTLALPKEVGLWSLTTIGEKLVKIGAKVLSHGRYVTFQLAEWAFEHSQTTNIKLSDDWRGNGVSLAAESTYDFRERDAYLGNAGLGVFLIISVNLNN